MKCEPVFTAKATMTAAAMQTGLEGTVLGDRSQSPKDPRRRLREKPSSRTQSERQTPGAGEGAGRCFLTEI